jgi:cytochrome P450
MPSYELNLDADVYANPEKFDPWRFLRMRETGDPNKFQFANVSEDSINFGAGSHACPGRFFASNEIKLIIVELFLSYEMKYPAGTERPPNMIADFQVIPNMAAEILVREKYWLTFLSLWFRAYKTSPTWWCRWYQCP